MASALGLRLDFDGAELRRLTLAAIYEGASRGEAARIGGVTLPTG
ncbi:hypothetical protein NUH86_08950 [Sphingobium sp. JS3065]|nr:hypothetical protein [Sphingobium sp. JS3065]UZW56968.1 hypothetical protein NUH86_08950 [Sphingobium sp. JS3065]